jgi:hypothetical protein
VEYIAQFIPKWTTIDIMLESKEKDTKADQCQAEPDPISGRILSGEPLVGQF